jgi:quercetin dioxygenase-like cupin family protein
MPAHVAAGPELLAVEAGTLEVLTSEGQAWRAQGATRASELEPAAPLAPRAGVVVEPGTVAAFRNAGDAPLVLLVAILMPANLSRATPVPEPSA